MSSNRATRESKRQPSLKKDAGATSSPIALEISHLIQAIHSDYESARSSLDALQVQFRQSAADLEQARRLVGLFAENEPAKNFTHEAGDLQSGRYLIRVNLLGPFRASIGGNEITNWNSTKARAIFTYLVNNPRRRIAREQLIEALWPSGEVEAASNSLRVAIHALRQALAAVAGGDKIPGVENLILFDNGVYLFAPKVQFAIDVEEFERHWHDGRRLELAGGREEAVHEYELAEAAYHGDFLQEDPYEEWSMLRRESLKDIYLSILGRLSETSLEAGNCERSILMCQKIIDNDPCREDTYQRLMRAHILLGQPGRARRWFQICVRVLKEELDLPPSEETLAVYRELFGNR